MANTLDPMDLKQIITLHLDGYSNRSIGTSLGISRNTVNTYMRLFKGSDHTFKELLSFGNARLESLFSSHTTIDNGRYDGLMHYLGPCGRTPKSDESRVNYCILILLQVWNCCIYVFI